MKQDIYQKKPYKEETSPYYVNIKDNIFHGPFLLHLHGREINGSLWSRIKTAFAVVFKPNTVVRNTLFVITGNIFESETNVIPPPTMEVLDLSRAN